MLDLIKGLPFAIVVDGRSFPIKTDFRIWLRFGQISSHYKDMTDDELMEVLDIFTEQRPSNDEMVQAMEELNKFNYCREVTPKKSSNGSADVPLSLDYDGSYIYAAFIQSYNINLMTDNLHWHEFNALLRSLPNDTKLSEIMGFRCYQKNSTSIENQYRNAKKMWILPLLDDVVTMEEMEEMEMQAQEDIKNEFYNCI